MTEKKDLTEIELSAIYGIGLRQLRLMRMRGSGPRYLKVSGSLFKVGGRVLYRVEDIESWLASRPSGGEQSLVATWPPRIEKRKS
jgi:hypothetical protein